MKDESHGSFATIGTPAGGMTGAALGFFIGIAAVSLFGPTAFLDVDQTMTRGFGGCFA